MFKKLINKKLINIATPVLLIGSLDAAFVFTEVDNSVILTDGTTFNLDPLGNTFDNSLTNNGDFAADPRGINTTPEDFTFLINVVGGSADFTFRTENVEGNDLITGFFIDIDENAVPSEITFEVLYNQEITERGNLNGGGGAFGLTVNPGPLVLDAALQSFGADGSALDIQSGDLTFLGSDPTGFGTTLEFDAISNVGGGSFVGPNSAGNTLSFANIDGTGASLTRQILTLDNFSDVDAGDLIVLSLDGGTTIPIPEPSSTALLGLGGLALLARRRRA